MNPQPGTSGTYSERNTLAVSVLLLGCAALVVSCVCSRALQGASPTRPKQKPTAGKKLATDDVVIPARNWDTPFKPVATLFGSYSSFVRRGETYEVWNNTIGDGPEDGIVRFTGPSPVEFEAPRVVIPHRIINDVLDKDGNLSSKRRYTRPSVVWDPKDGYFAVAHVCNSASAGDHQARGRDDEEPQRLVRRGPGPDPRFHRDLDGHRERRGELPQLPLRDATGTLGLALRPHWLPPIWGRPSQGL